jgi:hypothetical protein
MIVLGVGDETGIRECRAKHAYVNLVGASRTASVFVEHNNEQILLVSTVARGVGFHVLNQWINVGFQPRIGGAQRTIVSIVATIRRNK